MVCLVLLSAIQGAESPRQNLRHRSTTPHIPRSQSLPPNLSACHCLPGLEGNSCVGLVYLRDWWTVGGDGGVLSIIYHHVFCLALGKRSCLKTCEKKHEESVVDGTKHKKYLWNPFPKRQGQQRCQVHKGTTSWTKLEKTPPSSCEKGRNMDGLTQLQKVQHRHRQENAEITEITHHLSWVIGTCTLSCSSSRWCRYCNQSDSSWSPAKSSSQLKHSSSTPPRNWIQNGFCKWVSSGLVP